MFAHLPVFKKAYISCLRLHPGNVNWLFCGADHGKIALIDTGLSGSTDYKIAWQKIKMVPRFSLLIRTINAAALYRVLFKSIK